MFELIKQLLGKSSQSSIEQQQVVESSPEPATQELVIDNYKQENVAESKYQEQSAVTGIGSLQQQLNTLGDPPILSLWPPNGEYPGPIIINHPLTLDGQGATIWALTGPVLSIQSDRVILKNLRIEVTGSETISSQRDYCAIMVNSGQNLEFDNVEVRGTAMGLPEEEGEWKYPSQLNLGKLAPRTEYNLRLRIVVPVACKIESQISGLEFTPRNLTPGDNEIQLHLEGLSPSTYINGSIFLVSASLKRRVTLTAYIDSEANTELLLIQNPIVWQPEDSPIVVDTTPLLPNQAHIENIENEVYSKSNIISAKKQDESQPQKSLRVNKIHREVKPNNQIFLSISANNILEEPLQQDSEIKKQSQLGGAFTTSNSDSPTQQTISNQGQFSESSSSRIKSYNRPNSIFNYSQPSPSEPLENPEDASIGSGEK
ncbi:MAG: hypothetical protein RMY28_028825 [Nostoc sp. ChiSLP01]|nr:hypothetical protein [Nostoc sp. CmiSLP01]MDZ8284108.1 hypothetical protein [Nostoc sp. ChiSLP01]